MIFLEMEEYDELENIPGADTETSMVQEASIIPSQLSQQASLKLEVIQSLLEPCDRHIYGERLREGANKLGVTVRTVQRLFKDYQNRGLVALTETRRADLGEHRISDFWQEFIVKTYKQGNKGSRRITPKQVSLKVQAKAMEIGDRKPPSYKTVLRVLKPLIDKKEKAKSIRSPGWQGSSHSVKTRDGQEIEITHSNQVWQCDHTRVDVLLVNQYGELMGRPWLTTVIDSYSRCILGVQLSFDAPSSLVVALALRHAILPKQYEPKYELESDWETYGLPEYLYTDGGKDFRSQHLSEVATELGFVLKLRRRPSEGGIVERPFKTFNQSLFSSLPGYTASNVQERSKQAEKDARLTLEDLEVLVIRFIVDRYNQSIDTRMGDQTRYQRWEAGLIRELTIIPERKLDICLMKQERRKVQRGGYILFENINYRGEYLAGYAGETIILRYDPRDITTILIYRRENNQEVFLTRAHAQNLETEKLSLNEAKTSSKRLREAGKSINNESILRETVKREEFVEKKTRKQKQKEEQSYQQSQKATFNQTIEFNSSEDAVEETSTNLDSEIAEIEVWDLEQMNEDYGF